MKEKRRLKILIFSIPMVILLTLNSIQNAVGEGLSESNNDITKISSSDETSLTPQIENWTLNARWIAIGTVIGEQDYRINFEVEKTLKGLLPIGKIPIYQHDYKIFLDSLIGKKYIVFLKHEATAWYEMVRLSEWVCEPTDDILSHIDRFFSSSPIKIILQLDKKKYPPGEPIEYTLIIENTSKQDLYLEQNLFYGDMGYQFVLVDSLNRPVRELITLCVDRLGPTKFVKLDNGNSWEVKGKLPILGELKPGDYRLYAEFLWNSNGGEKGTLVSEVVPIYITTP